jgi:hypothetical protein
VITHTSELAHLPGGTDLRICAREPEQRRSYLLLGRCPEGEPLDDFLARGSLEDPTSFRSR